MVSIPNKQLLFSNCYKDPDSISKSEYVISVQSSNPCAKLIQQTKHRKTEFLSFKSPLAIHAKRVSQTHTLNPNSTSTEFLRY